MAWQARANELLGRTAGLEVRRRVPGTLTGRRMPVVAEAGTGRLVASPIFILCSVRSGSTLLRVLLNGHPDLHAPHELHLRRVKVVEETRLASAAMRESGLARSELDHLLWDRILHRHLELTGKARIVEKTPSNVLMWRRLAQCWPDAMFVFLIRHPWSIATSWQEANKHKGLPAEKPLASVLKYLAALDEARRALPGLTVRYEDLVADPARETRRICEYVGVQWVPDMVDYGRHDHGRFKRGLGDWSPKIRSGVIQAARPVPPGPVPEPLRLLCASWGYAVADAAS